MTAKTLRELHELASLGEIAKEHCHEAAWEIANATSGPSQRSMVVYRYEQIAADLCSHRGKPLSSDQVKLAEEARKTFWLAFGPTKAEAKASEKFRKVESDAEASDEKRKQAKAKRERLWKIIKERGRGLTKAEAKASEKFRKVENDDEASDEKKKQAKAKRERLWKKVEERERPLFMALIAATDASGTFPFTRADRLLIRWNRDKKKLYWKFARTIKRFCHKREKGRQPRSAHGPLIEMLCDEWRRNDKALWTFLSACFRTWNDVKNIPESVLRRRIVIHQIAPELGTSPGRIQTYLHAIGALPPVKGGAGDVQEAQERLITKDISLGLSKARTKSFGGW